MITLNDCKQAEQYSFKGLSTNVKPVNCASNSLFFQLNGATFYYFNKGDGLGSTANWRKVGG